MTRATGLLLAALLGGAFGGSGCSTLHAMARDAAAAAVAEARPALEAAADRARTDALDRAEKIAREVKDEAKAFARGLAEEAAEKGKAVAVDAGAAATGAVVAKLEDRVAELQARKGTEDEGTFDRAEMAGGGVLLLLAGLANKWLNQRKDERLLLTPPPITGPLVKPPGATA